MSDLMEMLRSAGIRPTKSRLAVLTELQRSPRAQSAQEIFVSLKRTAGLATIYRALGVLAEANIVETFNEGDEALFRLCGDEHHHHLVCDSCGLVEEIESAEVEAWVARVSRRRSFTVTAHRADIYGLCASCR